VFTPKNHWEGPSQSTLKTIKGLQLVPSYYASK
jgi:hypothetical protein